MRPTRAMGAARTAVALLVLASGAAAGAAVEDGALAYKCRGHPGFDSDQDVRLARVKPVPGGRLHFFRDDDAACPRDAARCKRKAFVVTGDVLLVDRVAGGWACAWYAGSKGSTMGYLAAHDLEFIEPAMPPALDAWVGEWVDVDSTNTLGFTRRADRLLVAGQALWYGGTNDAGYENVHTGEIGDLDDDGNPVPVEVRVQGDTARLEAAEEFECGATFRRIGDYLLVADNSSCGGMNVRFDGVYRRSASNEARNP